MSGGAGVEVLGIHHVTSIASDPQRNLDFYIGVLGLRFVKRTVNFDDPHTYHFYFGDDVGRPGSIMTFFPWPRAFRGRQGTGQVAVTAFAIPPDAVGFWIARLLAHGVAYDGPRQRDDERVIAFRDHDGLMLELVAHESALSRSAWEAPDIPRDRAIRGFHSVTLWEEHGDRTERLLTEVLGFREWRASQGTRTFTVGGGGAGTIVNVRTIGGFVSGQPGAGTVHHVAFRVPDDTGQLAVRSRIMQAGYEPTPVIDRDYFHSVYFREPGGVLFEVATDPPGFSIDEPVESLGAQLKLPKQYEPHRSEIEAVLPRIHLPAARAGEALFRHMTGPEDVSGDALGFVHRYIPPGAQAPLAGGTTLLLLHGTGGDEDSLVSLGRRLLPGAALLSPRGKVNEGGALRFFRRIREGVFDQEDLRRQTEALARFVSAAAETYSLEARRIVAVGFSNGANIAASMLLRHPAVLGGAVLLSPMIPFEPADRPALHGTPVFIGAGRGDAMVPAEQTERLATLLIECGADVQVHWETGGHTITADEVAAAQRWLAERFTD